jgi:hypothetical protein
MNFFPDYNINATSRQIEKKDKGIDIFLIYEELRSVDGKAPPTVKKDLCEFLSIKRQPFIKCFHIIAVHPRAQFYLARDLHNTVHGRLLRPAIHPFLQGITQLSFRHMYYSASTKNHLNPFLSILNGKAVENLQSFHKLDYNIAMSKLRPSVVGQR